ncbi:MAG: type IV pilin, partial [Spirochaetes bacterium]|nr:type IV pilin [Spirochaetota bacterium]
MSPVIGVILMVAITVIL